MNSFPMKNFSRALIVGIFSMFLMLTHSHVFGQAAAPQLSGERTGYALGVSIGRNMKDLSIDIDPGMIVRGITDTVRGQPTLSDQEISTILDAYEKEVIRKLAEKNKRDGAAFLRENAQRKTVVTLPSGLQYMVLRQGAGDIPKNDDLVTFHYRARLVDGTEFESSHWNNRPVDIVVGNTIKGWAEALTKMPVGSLWRLYIPSELAYGEVGAGPVIGPNAVIICDLELLAIR